MDDTKLTVTPMGPLDIIWCPHQRNLHHYERYIIRTNIDMKLHVVDQVQQTTDVFGGVNLTKMTNVQMLLVACDYQKVRSFASNNTLLESNDTLYAIGQNNGRILLSSFDSNSTSNLINKEFVIDQTPVTALDFNQIDNNLLAAGYYKTKSSPGVRVWDIAHSLTKSKVAIHSLGDGEMVNSLKFYQDWLIIAGLESKLRVFDIRESTHNNTTKAQANLSGAVGGITLDNFSSNRFASYNETKINVWDIRNIESPVITIDTNCTIVKLEWCPTKNNILAALLKDTNSIRLYDFKDFKNLNNVQEPTILSREVAPFQIPTPQVIASFSWNPHNEFRMTAVSTNGHLRDFRVIDRITLNWSPVSEIIWTQGKKILQCIDPRDNFYQQLDDIAVQMRKLAIEGYGLSSDKLWQSFRLNDPLYSVWKWMSLRIIHPPTQEDIKSRRNASAVHTIKDLFSANNPERLCGILGVLFNESRTQLLHQSEQVTLPESSLLRNRKLYTSLSRAYALQHCGWSSSTRFLDNIDVEQFGALDWAQLFDEDMPCSQLIDSSNNLLRIMAIMVFNGKICEAIDLLKRAASPRKSKEDSMEFFSDPSIDLNVIALTLSAYLTSTSQMEKNNIWIDMCEALMNKYDDPYIKATFTFLSMTNFEDNDYKSILTNRQIDIDISDRIALACMYLTDRALAKYIIDLRNRLFKEADLSAIVLTGVTEEGVELFSKYIEDKCDVQTISFILLWSLPNTICDKPICKNWIENYKQLLDCWRLWNERAMFDIKWYSAMNFSETPNQHIYVACHYCRNPVASYMVTNENVTKGSQSQSTLQQQHQFNRNSSSNASSKFRKCSCSNCYKSLPRCSLCLTQMGTLAGTYWRPGLLFSKSDRKLSPFASWFTWCQMCRHGGHAAHLTMWFLENTVCPVTGCKCKCMSLDANARLM